MSKTRKWYTKGLYLVFAIALVAGFNVMPAAVPMVAASPDVSNVRVELSDYTAGAASNYYIYFTPNVDLVAGVDKITILFPVDTTGMGNITGGVAGDCQVDEDGDAIWVRPDAVNAAVQVAGYRIEVTTPNNMPAGTEARIDFLGGPDLTNPTTNVSYKVTLWTSQETTHVDSAAYIIGATSVAAAGFGPANNPNIAAADPALAAGTVGQTDDYVVLFTLSTAGALAANWDTITITFPPDTTVPSSISANSVYVSANTTAGAPTYNVCTEAPVVDGRKVRVKTPVNIAVDADAGNALAAMGGGMMYNDPDLNGYEVGDPVYWDADASGTVTVDDIRISNPPVPPVGSQAVCPGDIDCGNALAAVGGALAYNDADGSVSYNVNDPVYWDADASGTVTVDDIRISNPPGGTAVGSQVAVGDGGGDIGNALAAVGGGMMYNDANVSGTYNVGDPVYWDADASGTVTVDDIRISNPPVPHAVGDQVAADADVADVLAAFPAGAAMAYDDPIGGNNNGVYDAGDPVYFDADADGLVSVDDIRIANPPVPPVGSQVAAGEADVGRAIAAFPAGAAMAYDDPIGGNNNGAYDAGDPVYFDADADGAVSVDDIRIANPPVGAVGSQVAAGEADVGRAIAAFPAGAAMMYNDTNASGAYNTGDRVYWDADASGTVTVDDVRLCDPTATYVVGSQVAGDADAANALAAVGGGMMYNDADVSGTYNGGDPVYWDADASGTVTVDDIRISNPPVPPVGSQVVAVPPDVDLGTLLAPVGGAMMYFDLDGSTTYTAGDRVYWDADASGTVTGDDIRISNPPVGFAVGSQVVAGYAGVYFTQAAGIKNPTRATDALGTGDPTDYVGKVYTSQDTGSQRQAFAQVMNAKAASALSFDPTSASSVLVNTASGNINIWTIDMYGNLADLPVGVTIDIDLVSSSATGTFYDLDDAPDGLFNDNEATVPVGGNHTATFQYQDSTPSSSSYTITASYGTWTPVTWDIEVFTLAVELYDGEVLIGTYNTIGAAIADALATNTIKVGPGTYAEAPNIVAGKNDLTIESTDGAANTTIDPNAAGVTVTVASIDVTIKGFSIQNSNIGATILVDADSNGLTLEDCILDLTVNAINDVGVDVAGINDVTISNCEFTIEETLGVDDIAIDASGAAVRLSVEDCTIAGSSGIGYDDALLADVTFTDCTFDGTDIALDINNNDSTTTVDNCTFINGAENTPPVGAIDVALDLSVGLGNLLVRESTFQDNAGYSINAAATGDNIRAIFNSFLNNAEGMSCVAVTNLNALHNYWGDPSGPGGVAAGSGDAISTFVDFDLWFNVPVSAGEFANAAASLDAQTTVGASISGADATVADLMVARYTENPVATLDFTPIENGFFDVYVSAVGGATEVGIKFYDAAITSDHMAYMWDAFEEVWKPCTEQSSTAGMTWVKARPFDADHPRVPTIEDLSGTVFAIGSAMAIVTLESIDATPDSVSLDVGGTQALTVTATYSDASTADVTDAATYVSDNTAVATVSPAGVITGVAEGSATITVSYAEADVTVTDTVPVTVSPVTPFDPMDYDENDNGVISKAEAIDAVQDYFNDEITKEQAIEVVTLYFA